MNSTKILLITSEFPPQPGGIGNHAYNLALSLVQKGKEVTVLTDVRSSTGSEEDTFDRSLSFKVERVKRYNVLVRTYLKRIAQAKKLIRNHDTLIFSGKFPLFLLHWLHRKDDTRKWVSIVHGSELLLPNKRQSKWVRHALRKSDNVIAVSNYTASLIRDPSVTSVSVIPNGYSVQGLRHAIKLNRFNPLRLITVGNITERKGQHNVVRAVPKLLEYFPNLEYHLVGIPTEGDTLIELAKELGVSSSLIIHGRVEEEAKIQLLQQSSIFMMLSQATITGDVEGFGIAILEANACGVPAIGSIDTGIVDAIKEGFSGELVPHDDLDAIVKAVKKIHENYQSFVEHSRKWAEEFHWDKIIERYLEVLDR